MKINGSPAPNAAAGWIYVHSAARRVGCSRRTVRRWIEEGRLRAYRPGRRCWMLLSSDVEDARIRWEAVW